MTERFAIVEVRGAQVGVTRISASEAEEDTAEVAYSFFLQDIQGASPDTEGLVTFTCPVVGQDGAYLEEVQEGQWNMLTSYIAVEKVVERALESHRQAMKANSDLPSEAATKFIHQPPKTLQ